MQNTMKPANWCRVQCSASEAFLRWVIVLSFLLSLSCIHVYAATTFFTVGPQDRTYVAGSGGMRVIDNPSGAYFTSSTNNHAGAIKITLPFNFTSTMMFLTIKGFEYDTRGSWVVEAGGYNYIPASGSGYWANEFAMVQSGSPPFTRVRFGHNQSHAVIVLGTTVGDGGATDFDYPKVFVDQVMLGALSVNLNWHSGWRIEHIINTTGLVFTGDETTTKVWTQSNDGTGSGMDADTLDGFDSSAFGCSSTCGNSVLEAGEGCDDGGTSWTSGACAGDCSRRNYWSNPLVNGEVLNNMAVCIHEFCSQKGFRAATSSSTSTRTCSAA